MLVSRRHALLASALTGLGGLSACSLAEGGSGEATASATPGAVSLATGYLGVPVTVEAGPAIISGSYMVVRLAFSTQSTTPVSLAGAFDTKDATGTMRAIRALSLAQGLAFPQLETGNKHFATELSKDAPLEVFPIFAAATGATSVELELPSMGVITGIPVVGASQAPFEAGALVSRSSLDVDEPGPFGIGALSIAHDDASDTSTGMESTTVTLTGGVAFPGESVSLDPRADAAIARVVALLKRYPAGGELTITGHVDSSAHEALAEQRAQAVEARLKESADLSGWKVSATGKGATALRVPNEAEQGSAINRRVEIAVTPADPGSAAPTPVESGPDMPDAVGPSGKGPAGVEVTVGDLSVRLSMERVLRVGSFLVGVLELSCPQRVDWQVGAFMLPPVWQTLRWRTLSQGVYNLTLIDGEQRHLTADYAAPTSGRWVLSNSAKPPLEPGEEPWRVPVIWRDTGQDTVILDLPGGDNAHGRALSARLTDIPVVDA
ncbi:OmpA family protein [Actinomyces slackii]|uniref:Outer membrane porin F n=1 Tax=Actinomyces slackii TaxID=52774 RepID=A0A448KGG7_9ACTO|nr:OmpA family protein [Actinomyces slackii]VEG75991.1 Outer membrane porin F precursor [Actinomyces slackii]